MTVDVELMRPSDAADLARSLSTQGLSAELRNDGHVVVSADDIAGVEHAVEGWAAARGLPFVSHHLDGQRVVLCPPGS
jgi:hypothetical protein